MKKVVKIIFTLFVCFAVTSCGENPSQLPVPSNIRMDGYILTWDEVPHAVGYAVKIGGNEPLLVEEPLYDVGITIRKNVIKDDKLISFDVQLMSIAYPNSGYTNSGWSLSFNKSFNTDDILYGELLDTAAHVLYNTSEKTLFFDFRGISDLKKALNYPDRYSNGVLTVYPTERGREIEKIHIKGTSTFVNGLCIKISGNNWKNKPKIILENIHFGSSNSLPLIDIEPSADFTIEYRGDNELSSSSNNLIPSLIRSESTITFKAADDDSRFTLKTNEVKNSDKGSIGIEANEIIIDGGVFKIIGSNGKINGGDGSAGIEANTTTIRGNAVVNITAGNGADGSQGISGINGESGWTRQWIWQDPAGNGGAGGSGGAGGNGGNGGDAIHGDLVFESSTCIVTLKGGDGGNGGKGGKGGRGGNGGDNAAWGGGTGSGGKGGKGGNGGRGGNGGNAVSGRVTNKNSESSFSDGKGGTGGAGGSGGSGGAPGDYGWNCGSGGEWGTDGNSGASGANGTPGMAIASQGILSERPSEPVISTPTRF